jgi:hypothetical protein
MDQTQPVPALLLSVLAAFSLTTVLYSQTGGLAEPPGVMHWCAQHCTTLTWNNGHYGGPDSIWIVEKWTRESVVIRRTDYRPYAGVAVLTGRLSQQGDSIENGRIQWTYHPCCGLSAGTFQAAWGPAIHTVPGSDQERAQMARLQTQPTLLRRCRRFLLKSKRSEPRYVHRNKFAALCDWWRTKRSRIQMERYYPGSRHFLPGSMRARVRRRFSIQKTGRMEGATRRKIRARLCAAAFSCTEMSRSTRRTTQMGLRR